MHPQCMRFPASHVVRTTRLKESRKVAEAERAERLRIRRELDASLERSRSPPKSPEPSTAQAAEVQELRQEKAGLEGELRQARGEMELLRANVEQQGRRHEDEVKMLEEATLCAQQGMEASHLWVQRRGGSDSMHCGRRHRSRPEGCRRRHSCPTPSSAACDHCDCRCRSVPHRDR